MTEIRLPVLQYGEVIPPETERIKLRIKNLKELIKILREEKKQLEQKKREMQITQH